MFILKATASMIGLALFAVLAVTISNLVDQYEKDQLERWIQCDEDLRYNYDYC